ncbi:hypothetical protein TNCV_2199911 [Trichonephila clavipes]|nr:hypothetical protein TNCV_2199911 [Trichonephila clavipes]
MRTVCIDFRQTTMSKDRLPVKDLKTSQRSRSFVWGSIQDRAILTLKFEGKSIFDLPLVNSTENGRRSSHAKVRRTRG